MPATLRRERNGFSWDVDIRGSTALGQLAPVLWSAGDLLTGARLDKVKRCANPECGWLFLDDSRAGKRRWCSMTSCGNRAKARALSSQPRAVPRHRLCWPQRTRRDMVVGHFFGRRDGTGGMAQERSSSADGDPGG